MFKLKVEWIIVFVLLVLGLFLVLGFRERSKPMYSLDKAQFYLSINHWDSAIIHAEGVLDNNYRKADQSLANTIISLASEHLDTEYEEKLSERKKIFETLEIDYDSQDKTTWYKHPLSTDLPNEPALYMYMAEKGGEYWARLRIQYSGDEYLFINSVQFDADDKGFSFSPKGQVQRKHGDQLVWEWIDEGFNMESYAMLHNIAFSKKAILRYMGASSFVEREIGLDEKKALQAMLKAYDLRNL